MMKDEGKPPELGETLDAPVYEPPKRRFPILPVVVTATVAVAAILLFVVRFEHRTIREPRIRPTMQWLAAACEAYQDVTGEFPWPMPARVQAGTTISTREVCAVLRTDVGLKAPLLGELPKEFAKEGTLVDRWGHEILIRVDPKTGDPVIWSCGPNGIDETNDGESPDPAKFPKGYYWFGKGDTGDDIVAR